MLEVTGALHFLLQIFEATDRYIVEASLMFIV